MPDENDTSKKKVRKKAENPFERAGYELVQIRFHIEKVIKNFSEEDRKNPNYKQFLKDVKSEVEKAIDHRSRDDHGNLSLRNKIQNLIVLAAKNPVFLAIICIIIGALLGNVELLKTVLNFIKG